MKGTNPITQGHRWQKRVKQRLKKQQLEEGQWEQLEDKEWEEVRAQKQREETAVAAEADLDLGARAIFAAADAGTDLRDEEGLDAEELAAVRAVKAAKAAAQARLQRVQREGEQSEESDALPRSARSHIDSPPRLLPTPSRHWFARDPARARQISRRRQPRRPRRPRPNPAPNSEPRKYRAGLAAEIAKKRAIGVAGVTGGSQKKLKSSLKKKRAAGLA